MVFIVLTTIYMPLTILDGALTPGAAAPSCYECCSKLKTTVQIEGEKAGLRPLWLLQQKYSSLVAQWLRIHTSTARGMGLISGWGTKIQHAVQCSQKKTSNTTVLEARKSSLKMPAELVSGEVRVLIPVQWTSLWVLLW